MDESEILLVIKRRYSEEVFVSQAMTLSMDPCCWTMRYASSLKPILTPILRRFFESGLYDHWRERALSSAGTASHPKHQTSWNSLKLRNFTDISLICLSILLVALIQLMGENFRFVGAFDKYEQIFCNLAPASIARMEAKNLLIRCSIRCKPVLTSVQSLGRGLNSRALESPQRKSRLEHELTMVSSRGSSVGTGTLITGRRGHPEVERILTTAPIASTEVDPQFRELPRIRHSLPLPTAFRVSNKQPTTYQHRLHMVAKFRPKRAQSLPQVK